MYTGIPSKILNKEKNMSIANYLINTRMFSNCMYLIIFTVLTLGEKHTYKSL